MLVFAFFLTYLIGGLTFVPLVLACGIATLLFLSPTVDHAAFIDGSAGGDKSQRRDDASAEEKAAGDGNIPQESKDAALAAAESASGSSRPVITGWLTIRRTYEAQSSAPSSGTGSGVEGNGSGATGAGTATTTTTAAGSYMNSIYRGFMDYRRDRNDERRRSQSSHSPTPSDSPLAARADDGKASPRSVSPAGLNKGSPSSLVSISSSSPARTGGGRGQEPMSFHCVLKPPILYLYTSSDPPSSSSLSISATDCYAAIDVSRHVVEIFPPVESEGEIFAKRNAIHLFEVVASADGGLEPTTNRRRMPSEADGKGEGQIGQLGDGGGGEADGNGTAMTSTTPPTGPRDWYLFARTNMSMEDWYHALLNCSASSPLVRPAESVLNTASLFSSDDMLGMLTSLDTLSDPLPLRWFNALLGRVFFSVYRTAALPDYIKAKLDKKLSRVKTPGFLGDVEVREVDIGRTSPLWSRPMLKEARADGETSMEVAVHYAGSFRLVISTSVTLSLPTARLGLKPYTIPLVLSVTLTSLEGNLLLRIKPPPSNRIWYGFTTMPKLGMLVEPIVSERRVQWGVVTRQIEARLREVLQESIVLPHMDDVPFFDTGRFAHRGGIWDDARMTARTARKEKESAAEMTASGLAVEADVYSAGKEGEIDAVVVASGREDIAVRDSHKDLRRGGTEASGVSLAAVDEEGGDSDGSDAASSLAAHLKGFRTSSPMRRGGAGLRNVPPDGGKQQNDQQHERKRSWFSPSRFGGASGGSASGSASPVGGSGATSKNVVSLPPTRSATSPATPAPHSFGQDVEDEADGHPAEVGSSGLERQKSRGSAGASISSIGSATSAVSAPSQQESIHRASDASASLSMSVGNEATTESGEGRTAGERRGSMSSKGRRLPPPPPIVLSEPMSSTVSASQAVAVTEGEAMPTPTGSDSVSGSTWASPARAGPGGPVSLAQRPKLTSAYSTSSVDSTLAATVARDHQAGGVVSSESTSTSSSAGTSVRDMFGPPPRRTPHTPHPSSRSPSFHSVRSSPSPHAEGRQYGSGARNGGEEGNDETASTSSSSTSFLLSSWNKAKTSTADKQAIASSVNQARDAVKRWGTNWNNKRLERKGLVGTAGDNGRRVWSGERASAAAEGEEGTDEGEQERTEGQRSVSDAPSLGRRLIGGASPPDPGSMGVGLSLSVSPDLSLNGSARRAGAEQQGQHRRPRTFSTPDPSPASAENSEGGSSGSAGSAGSGGKMDYRGYRAQKMRQREAGKLKERQSQDSLGQDTSRDQEQRTSGQPSFPSRPMVSNWDARPPLLASPPRAVRKSIESAPGAPAALLGSPEMTRAPLSAPGEEVGDDVATVSIASSPRSGTGFAPFTPTTAKPTTGLSSKEATFLSGIAPPAGPDESELKRSGSDAGAASNSVPATESLAKAAADQSNGKSATPRRPTSSSSRNFKTEQPKAAMMSIPGIHASHRNVPQFQSYSPPEPVHPSASPGSVLWKGVSMFGRRGHQGPAEVEKEEEGRPSSSSSSTRSNHRSPGPGLEDELLSPRDDAGALPQLKASPRPETRGRTEWDATPRASTFSSHQDREERRWAAVTESDLGEDRRAIASPKVPPQGPGVPPDMPARTRAAVSPSKKTDEGGGKELPTHLLMDLDGNPWS